LVFVQLRKWRLQRCRELQLEAYKIFQNRTICEMIRRKRNNPEWGVDSTIPLSAEENNSVANTSNVADQINEKVNNDLLECWGVGPSKVMPGGFAHEALTVLSTAESNELFIQSRDFENASKQNNNSNLQVEEIVNTT
jgi:hypothetical protein